MAAIWAWGTDIALLHSGREHLLPDIVFYTVAMLLSLGLGALYPSLRTLLDIPFVQLSFITICAAAQGAFLWLLSTWAARKGTL